MDVDIPIVTADYVFGRWGRVAFVVWRSKTQPDGVRAGERWFESVVEAVGGPILLLTVLEEKVKLPDLEARVELARFLGSAEGKIERSAVVFEGEGFRATSIRAVVSGVLIFSRPSYPHRVFSTVGAAARFLVGGRGGTPAPHLVIRATRDARRRPPMVAFPTWVPNNDELAPLRR